MNPGHIACLLATALLTSSGAASGGAIQEHDTIRAAAKSFMTGIVLSSHGTEPVVQAGALDTRLRLAQCDTPLEAFQPAGSRMLGNTTVGVRCTGTTSWTLYVPVRVSLFGKVAVAARPLVRNSTLTARDLKLERRDLAQLHNGYYDSIGPLVGKQVVRNAAINTALATNLVRDPLQVRRGQRIDLVASVGGLEVRMAGEALADGAAGERIKVRNLSSRRVIDGIVRSSTTIQVAM